MQLPFSSANPHFEPLLQRKPRVILFNKSDLADPYLEKRVQTAAMAKHFASRTVTNAIDDFPAIFCSCGGGGGRKGPLAKPRNIHKVKGCEFMHVDPCNVWRYREIEGIFCVHSLFSSRHPHTCRLYPYCPNKRGRVLRLLV